LPPGMKGIQGMPPLENGIPPMPPQ
jgi:hypothetical protein